MFSSLQILPTGQYVQSNHNNTLWHSLTLRVISFTNHNINIDISQNKISISIFHNLKFHAFNVSALCKNTFLLFLSNPMTMQYILPPPRATDMYHLTFSCILYYSLFSTTQQYRIRNTIHALKVRKNTLPYVVQSNFETCYSKWYT